MKIKRRTIGDHFDRSFGSFNLTDYKMKFLSLMEKITHTIRRVSYSNRIRSRWVRNDRTRVSYRYDWPKEQQQLLALHGEGIWDPQCRTNDLLSYDIIFTPIIYISFLRFS